jgi:hypothetical protein
VLKAVENREKGGTNTKHANDKNTILKSLQNQLHHNLNYTQIIREKFYFIFYRQQHKHNFCRIKSHLIIFSGLQLRTQTKKEQRNAYQVFPSR